MKKMIALVLTAVFLVALVGCVEKKTKDVKGFFYKVEKDGKTIYL